MVDSGEKHAMPRWVKASGIIAAVVVVLLLAVLVFGGGEHGPGRHAGAPDGRDHGDDHTPPEDGGRHEGNHTSPGDGGQHGGNHTSVRRGPVTWTVEVQDRKFTPVDLTIQAGDTVEWVHVGSEPHTVTADSFDSHPDCAIAVDGALGRCMEEGDTYDRTLDEAGDLAYHCKLHEGMVADIEVLHRYDATPDGR